MATDTTNTSDNSAMYEIPCPNDVDVGLISEVPLDDYIDRQDQLLLEEKQQNEENRLLQKLLDFRNRECGYVQSLQEEEREDYLQQVTKDERSNIVNLVNKHCKQMMNLIYKKKMEYYKAQNGNWKYKLEKSYPRDPPPIKPPILTKDEIFSANEKLFERVDAAAIKFAENNYEMYTDLVRNLVGNYETDLEKVRALFRLLTVKNLVFFPWWKESRSETTAISGYDDVDEENLYKGIKFSVDCKSLLFKRLCSYAGIHCEVVKGYCKSGSYLPGQEFVDTSYKNSWNCVFVAGQWSLIQINWANLTIHSKTSGCNRKIYQEHYFMTDPSKFIFEFFPNKSEWQLLEIPISLHEFEDLPLLRSTFFHHRLGLEGTASSILETNSRGEASIILNAPPEMHFHYELAFFKSRNTCVQNSNGIKISLARFLMQHVDKDGSVIFQFHAPHKGTYLLDIFGVSPYLTMEECQLQTEIKLQNLCRFKIRCASVNKLNIPLPNCSSGEWGPSKAVKLCGLIPISHSEAVIHATPSISMEYADENQKPLTLNIEFEMTKPLLDFMLRLINNEDQDNDKKSMTAENISKADYRIKNNSILQINLKMVRNGQYGLDIFARQNWGEKMFHCCKYIINCDV